MRRWVWPGVLALLLLVLRAPVPGQAYSEEVQAWRDKHEADYRREYVPLAGLFFLKDGANTAGSAAGSDIPLPARAPAAIGTFIYQDGRVRFVPSAGAGVTLRDSRLAGPVELADDAAKDGPDELHLGDIALWVHESGERRAIRMRDPQSAAAKSFAGFTWFPIDQRYRVVARFRKDPAPREIRVASLSGDDQTYTTEGMLEFELSGQHLTMRPLTTRPNRFFLVFTDGTSGRETYRAARFLYADLAPDGTAVLDFNQAYNPPCAFNPNTTCPLPLPENRLKIRIPAGERDYRGH